MDLENLKQLAQAATPGPWRKCGGATPKYTGIASVDVLIVDSFADHVEYASSAPSDDVQAANARYIAAANPAAVLELIAENERLRNERDDTAMLTHRLVQAFASACDLLNDETANETEARRIVAAMAKELLEVTESNAKGA